jgi:hypothetical protein
MKAKRYKTDAEAKAAAQRIIAAAPGATWWPDVRLRPGGWVGVARSTTALGLSVFEPADGAQYCAAFGGDSECADSVLNAVSCVAPRALEAQTGGT